MARLAGAATLVGTIALAGCGDGGHEAGAQTGAADAASARKAEPAAAPVHRFAKRSSGAYLYTASESEKNAILEAYPDFRYEGVGFDSGGPQPVYRFANLNNGGYFYTASEGERDSVLLNHRHLRYEGIAFRVAPADDDRRRPVFRLAHLRNGAYLYTLDAAERAAALALGHWRDEGIAWWADVPGAGAAPPPGQPGAQDPPTDPPAVPTPGPPSDGPQGLYFGESPDGWALRIAVLPNGDAWTLYGLPEAAGMQLQGFVHAKGTAEARVWTGRGRDYSVNRGHRGHVEATFGEGRFDGAVTTTRAEFRFTSALPAAGGPAPELSAVAGAWQGTLLDGAAATIDIATDGTLSGSSGGCSFSGALAPSASAVPVFAVTIAFGEQPCRIPLRSYDGVAILEALEDGSYQLLMPIVGLHGALGDAFSAIR